MQFKMTDLRKAAEAALKALMLRRNAVTSPEAYGEMADAAARCLRAALEAKQLAPDMRCALSECKAAHARDLTVELTGRERPHRSNDMQTQLPAAAGHVEQIAEPRAWQRLYTGTLRRTSPPTAEAEAWMPLYGQEAIDNAVAMERERCAQIAENTVCDQHLPTGVRIYGTRAARQIRGAGTTA